MILWHDKHDRYKLIIGYQYLNVNIDSGIARCKVNVAGYLYAYLIGDFNQWKKSKAYLMKWKADSNDGLLSMTADIKFDDSLTEGTHAYTFLLIDADGNEALLSNSQERFKAFEFIWTKPQKRLEIKSSRNVVAAGDYIDIIVIRNIGNNQREIVDANWSIEPKLSGISIHENRVYIDASIDKNVDKFTLKCHDHINSLYATREFAIVHETPLSGIRVHYFRRDGIYQSNNHAWDFWTYTDTDDESILPCSVNMSEETDFGMMGVVSNSNVIARKKAWDYGWYNEWSEQSGVFKLEDKSANYYIVDGDFTIYTNLQDVIFRTNPRIELAMLDDKSRIVAYLSDRPPVGTKFDLYINQVKQEFITSIVKDDRKQVIFIDLPKSLRANDFVTIHAGNAFLPCKVTMRNFLDKFYYNGHDMGCHFVDDKISLRIWAPTAKYVELLIYDNVDIPQDSPTHGLIMFCEPANGTHHIEIKASEFANKAYLYRLYFDDLDSKGNSTIKVNYAIDPYAYSVCTNGSKAFLIDINSAESKPDGWDNDVRPPLKNTQDSIIYETHVRDFSIHESSGVAPHRRGKFLGLAESGTHYKHESGKSVTTGIDSLVELGITHIHLLPIFDFSSVDERIENNPENRNWGYDPQNYNAPEGSYATSPSSPLARVLELRTAIHKLHQNGIRVVMDMVYNHMTDTGNMDKIVPGYYFRTDDHGKFTNGSGCGNELATERPMVRKFIIDSILHWVNNYHLDGTRFDLMELMDFDTMQLIVKSVKQIDPSLLVYGEPWKGGNSPLANGTFRGRQKNNNFAIFNDIFRDAIRGSNNPGTGFVNGNQHNPLSLWHVIEGLKGSINGLTAHAHESINYADAHDNYALWDQIEKSQNLQLEEGSYRKGLPQNVTDSTLVRQNMLALGIILTAQGIPFFLGGAEMLRTKQGDHNSYKSSDLINQFDWQDKATYKKVFDYVKGLISIRKNHPAFRMDDAHMINENLVINPAYCNDRSGVIVSHYKNGANGDHWKNIVIIYNGTAIDNYDVNTLLPIIDGIKQWTVVANHEQAGVLPISSHAIGKVPPIKSYSMCILHD